MSPTTRVEFGISAPDVAQPAEPQEPPPIELRGPSLASWKPTLGPGSERRSTKAWTHIATATKWAPIYRDNDRSHIAGWARAGAQLPAKRASGRSCRGSWYAVDGGYVCSTRGFRVKKLRAGARLPVPDSKRSEVGDHTALLPFQYVKVTRKWRAPRLKRLPTIAQQEEIDRAVENGDRLSSLVEKWLDGAVFAAVVSEHKVGERSYYRTTAGYYLQAKDVERLAISTLRGAFIDDELALPLAFVLKDSPLYCRYPASLQEDLKADAEREKDGDDDSEDGDDDLLLVPDLPVCGAAKRYARFSVLAELTIDDAKYVAGTSPHAGDQRRILIPRKRVRIARRVAPPDAIPDGAKWIHFDNSQQVFVAYEGDEPVYASLFSGGRQGHSTPTGLYQVERKYISKTMIGPDDDVGWYDVGDVPWTMYYRTGYAVHGAYWHDEFGYTRSHGCTNVAPADARWLFYWESERVPDGWHYKRRIKGTWLHYTGSAPPDGK